MFNVFFGDIGNSIRMEANSFTHFTNTENSTVAAATNLDNAPNPTSPSLPVPSTPSLKAPSLHADSITPPSIQIVDVEASEPVQPISAVHSLRPSSNKKKKDKGKAVAVPVSSTPNLKISDSLKKNDEFEGLNLSKAKASTSPRAKKQRTFLSLEDAIKIEHQLQEYVDKQTAYLKELDEFELEVEYCDELDHPTYFKKVDKVEVKVESGVELDHPAYFKKVDKVEVKVESGAELDHPAYF